MVKFKDLFSISSQEVDSIFKKSKICKKTYGLKLLQTDIINTLHYGKLLIITPKIVGKAYHRNLIRRQLKAIFYEKKLFLHQINFIILVYKPAIKLSFLELTQFMVDGCKPAPVT